MAMAMAMADDPMDPALWSSLPDHILEAVLALLPMATLLKLQILCKKWRATISSSPTFHRLLRSRSTPPMPFFLMFAEDARHRVGAAYDVELDKWHRIPLSGFAGEPLFVLGGDGGLFCLEGTGSQRGRLFISNPITRRHRKLPPMLFMPSPYFLIMVTNQCGRGYKILVTQDGESLSSQVYDSESDTWKMTGVLHRRIPLITGAVFHHGIVYCITFGPDGVVAFDLDNGLWHETGMAMPQSLTCPQLFENRGQLMMIGGIEDYGVLKGVYFWKLVHAAREWVEVNRVPEVLFKLFFESSSGYFVCMALGDQVCFHDYQFSRVLMYDLAQDVWKWVPSYSHSQTLESNNVLGFAFEPRLDATV